MGILYIKERMDDYELIKHKEEKLWGNIKQVIAIERLLFNKIIMKDINKDNKIMIIPRLYEDKELKNEKKKIKFNNNLFNQIKDKIKLCKDDNFKIDRIVLSKKIKQYKELRTILELNKYEIVKGKEFTRYCINSIIQYIYKYRKRQMREDNIAILIDEKDEFILEKIRTFAKQFRTVSIISNNLKQFEKFEKELYNKEGILINVCNNKKKSLLKMDIIINYNLKNGMMEQYEINQKAIVINLRNEKSINIQRKLMNGIYISGVEVAIDKTDELFEEFNIYNQFEILDIYEAMEYIENKKDKKYNIQKVKNNIDKNFRIKNPRIINLIGVNGKLKVREFI